MVCSQWQKHVLQFVPQTVNTHLKVRLLDELYRSCILESNFLIELSVIWIIWNGLWCLYLVSWSQTLKDLMVVLLALSPLQTALVESVESKTMNGRVHWCYSVLKGLIWKSLSLSYLWVFFLIISLVTML